MLVSELERTRYVEEGWCLVKGLVPLEVVAGVRERTAAIMAAPPASWPTGRFQFIDPARYPLADGEMRPGAMQRPALEEEVFAEMAGHERLQQAMREVLGADEVTLFTDQVGVKHGCITEEQGGRSYYHQDSWYWKIAPELGCNCWMPLHRMGEDSSGLAVIPRSQVGWSLVEHESYYDDPAWGREQDGEFVRFMRHRVRPDLVSYEGEVLLEMEPGDGLFFTNYTWHRSEPNRSGETKAFYAVAYEKA